MAGSLYIVATPIGNLSDITKRAVETLKSVDFILAEDTRVAAKLLSANNINTPVRSYHQHTTDFLKAEVGKWLDDGKNLALITDAGTPGISDPGNELIDWLLSSNPSINVIPIPGPSALSAALSVCGFNVSKFTFIGFWPKKGETKLLSQLKESGLSIVFYESPHRIVKTLKKIETLWGRGIRVFVGRELTKLHETLYRGNVLDVIEALNRGSIKGEIVVVIEGSA